jgi:two-component system, OmpR family, KDP operon response regulator KdpE
MSESRRILIVDDELLIRRALRTSLVYQQYEVCDARSGDEALDLVRSQRFDLVLLDINLPDMTGFEVCRRIRAGFDLGIIMLTVRTGEGDKVAALDAGADDYVTKPFDTPELLARIRANLRRHKDAAVSASDLFACDDFVVDFVEGTVARGEQKLSLSPKQCQLLRYLVFNRGKCLSHRTLLQAIWGPEYGEQLMLLQALIAQVRKKIEPDPSRPRYLTTIPRIGYQFN